MRRTGPTIAGFTDGERRPRAREHRQVLEAETTPTQQPARRRGPQRDDHMH